MAMNVGDTLLIGCDFSGGKDIDIVTVAKRVNGKMKFINVIQGEEAWILYQRLITFKEKGEL